MRERDRGRVGERESERQQFKKSDESALKVSRGCSFVSKTGFHIKKSNNSESSNNNKEEEEIKFY